MSNTKNKISISYSKVEVEKRVLKMIKFLRKNGRTKSKDLIKELNLKNTRSITKYKAFCEALGYTIQSTFGYNGGYELIEPTLTENELIKIKFSLNDDELFNKLKKVINRI